MLPASKTEVPGQTNRTESGTSPHSQPDPGADTSPMAERLARLATTAAVPESSILPVPAPSRQSIDPAGTSIPGPQTKDRPQQSSNDMLHFKAPIKAALTPNPPIMAPGNGGTPSVRANSARHSSEPVAASATTVVSTNVASTANPQTPLPGC